MALGLHEPLDLVDHERGFVVLVLRVVADDQLAADLLGPQMLRVTSGVVGDHGVRGVEDVLARPVVLLEDDHRRVRERLLEPHQVAVVRPAELVDRVVRHDAVRDEVVRPCDVEIEDGCSFVDELHGLHDLEPARRVDHDHATSHRFCGQERQGIRRRAFAVPGQPCDGAHRDVQHARDLFDRRREHLHVSGAHLETPGARPRACGAHAQTDRLQRISTFVVVAEERDPVHR